MDIGRFLEVVCETCSVYRESGTSYRKYYEWISHKDKNRPTSDDFLYAEWNIGGMGGGDCWGGVADRYTTNEVPGDLEDIDKVLEAVAPNISFIQYKRIIADVVKTGDYSRHEYYGNSSDYVYKTCRIRDLYDALKSRGLL